MSQPISGTALGIRDGYDRWARVYDHDRNPLPALEEPLMREMVGDCRGRMVLDLGCGTGRHSLWLAESGATVTGVDFSEGMIEAARKKPGADGVNFVVHDLHHPLPLEDGGFDLVVSGLVLEHLADLRPFFSEIVRVLRPGSKAVISAMHPAMFLRNSRARFTDPDSQEIVEPGSHPHSISDFLMAALHSGLSLRSIAEYAPDATFAEHYPRANKYTDWPMLVIMEFTRSA